jgi:class 3 adenylate cyclase
VAYSEKYYRWTWEFRSPPRALWPLVSNTDSFNRDCGFPPFAVRPAALGELPAAPGVRRLRSTYLGIVGEWEEREFEWVQPVRFAVDRVFTKGPLARMLQSCELAPNAKGGTILTYEMRVSPKNLLGALIVPVAIGFRMRRDAESVLKGYDEKALAAAAAPAVPRPPEPPSAGTPRLASLSWRLVSEARQPEPLVRSLCAYVTDADDLSVSKMRPYALADAWGTGRRETLDLFLHATRAGMLDFSWEVLCPHCRGSKPGKADLSSVTSQEHCESCGIDFTVNFDQSVELTFVPNPRVRKVSRLEYCLGGPQITPHVVAQKHLGPGENLCVAASFPEGRYRLRVQGVAVQTAFRIEGEGARTVTFDVGRGGSPSDEPAVAPDGILNILNTGPAEHLVVIERVAWSDQSVTAAAVTSRQMFRDLFSRDLLRPGERISVGAMTIVFTDLKNSTRLYREIGDAPAFGRVLDHFDTLKAAIAEEEGAIVKTMGDAVMAAFTHPAAALRAMRRAQADLALPGKTGAAFALKCSLHQGPCLAINQNDRLDYFGTTVNVCARLCALSTGSDIIVSASVIEDAEVAGIIANPRARLTASPESAELRGIGGTAFGFWRVTG